MYASFASILDLLNPEIQALAHHEVLVKQIDIWANDSLSRSCNHFEHLTWSYSDNCDVVFLQCLECQARGIFLNKDYIGLHFLDLASNDLDEGVLLVYLSLHVDVPVRLLHVAQWTVEQEDPRILYLSAHSSWSNILLEYHSVYVLAFLVIRVVNCDDFYKGVEVDGVV